MATPNKAETASVPSTGPWDSPALAQLREWEPVFVDQCLKMSNDPWTGGVLPRKDIELISLAVNAACTNLSRRRNPPPHSRRTRSRRDPRRDPDDHQDRISAVDPYGQPGRAHSVGRSEGRRCEADAEGTGGDAGLRRDESRGPMEYGLGRVLRAGPGVDGSDHRREPPGLHQRHIHAQAGGVTEHRRRCVDYSHVRARNTPAHPDRR